MSLIGSRSEDCFINPLEENGLCLGVGGETLVVKLSNVADKKGRTKLIILLKPSDIVGEIVISKDNQRMHLYGIQKIGNSYERFFIQEVFDIICAVQIIAKKMRKGHI